MGFQLVGVEVSMERGRRPSASKVPIPSPADLPTTFWPCRRLACHLFEYHFQQERQCACLNYDYLIQSKGVSFCSMLLNRVLTLAP